MRTSATPWRAWPTDRDTGANIAVAAAAELIGTFLLITLGLAVTGRFPWAFVPADLAAQIAGAVAGALATWVTFGTQAPGDAKLAVGFALTAGVLIAGPVTGGAVNPARALGPMLVAGDLSSVWLYVVGPVIGGILAAIVYDRFIAKGATPE